MRVRYDADGNVRVTMGPDATLADVLAHKIVVESIQRAHSVLGRAGDLVKRLRVLVLGGQHFPRGSLEWEAELEMLKLQDMLEQRFLLLESGAFTPEMADRLGAQITFHQDELDRYADIVASAEGRAGRGFVAAGERAATPDGHPSLESLGLDASQYQYYRSEAGPRGYQIRRVRAAGTEPYKLVEQGDGLVAVPAPEHNLRRPDVHARYVGAMDANARSRFDQLNKKSNLTDAEKEELTKLKAANEKRERMAELAEKTDRTPQEEFDLSKLKREARTHNMNDSVGATLQPRDTDTARMADLSAPDKGELSHAEQAELEQIERRQAAQAELEVRNDETRPQAERNKATEHLGNLAAEEYMTQAFPGAERVHMGEGAGTFDQVWRTRDRQYIIVEAKGGGGTNSSVREIDKLNYQQGSEKHAESVAGAMQKSATSVQEATLAKELALALDGGKVRYLEISQPLDASGKMSGIMARQYDLL